MSKVTTRKQRLSREQINIQREVEYIVRRAAERNARVVTLGPFVFFSTETGDAWLLDPSDHLALCLARDGNLGRSISQSQREPLRLAGR
jgi:hypothetical protein